MFRIICEKELKELGIIENYQQKKLFSDFVSSSSDLKNKMIELQEIVTKKPLTPIFISVQELVTNVLYFDTPEYKQFIKGTPGQFEYVVAEAFPPDDKIKKDIIYILKTPGLKEFSCKMKNKNGEMVEKKLNPAFIRALVAESLNNENIDLNTIIQPREALAESVKNAVYDSMASLQKATLPTNNMLSMNRENFAFNEFLLKDFDKMTPEQIIKSYKQFDVGGHFQINLSEELAKSIQEKLKMDPNSPDFKNNLKEKLEIANKDLMDKLFDLPTFRENASITVQVPVPVYKKPITVNTQEPPPPAPMLFHGKRLSVSVSTQQAPPPIVPATPIPDDTKPEDMPTRNRRGPKTSG